MDHGIPLVFAHAHQQSVAGNAGVVDQDVDAAEILDDLVHECLRLVEIRSVRAVAFGADAFPGQFGFEGLSFFYRRKVRKCNGSSLSGERLGDAPADAARSPRDEGDFAF